MRLHLDLHCGLAGDMFLAACLDLGLDLAELTSALATLGLHGWTMTPQRETRHGLAGLHLTVHTPHEHHHRHLSHILKIIHASQLPPEVQEKAAAIFHTLAMAEAEVHGTSPEAVHFHEVGAMDAILDICGAAFALWKLGVTRVSATPVTTGQGTVTCAHGVMPVPAPAVAAMLTRHHIPLNRDPVPGELLTPTGTAILVNLNPDFTRPSVSRIDAIGVGLGRRNLPDRANALRLLAQHDESERDALLRDQVTVLSAHIDDMNPQWFGPLMDALFQAGALDVALIPMTMKKGRPGIRLEVIAPPGQEETLARVMLTHTTTLGVRLAPMERLLLPRREETITTPWGAVRVKHAGGIPRVEHDDLAQLAAAQGWTLPQAQQYLLPHLFPPIAP